MRAAPGTGLPCVGHARRGLSGHGRLGALPSSPHRPRASLQLGSLSSGPGVEFGWGGVQERSLEARAGLMKAEARSPALRLGPALGPADSKVSNQPQGWTAGPSAVLPAHSRLQTQHWRRAEGSRPVLCSQGAQLDPRGPSPRVRWTVVLSLFSLEPSGLVPERWPGCVHLFVPPSRGWAPGGPVLRVGEQGGMEALACKGPRPSPRRGHVRRLSGRGEQSQGGRVWAAEAHAEALGRRGGGVLGVLVRSRGAGWGGGS